MSLFDQPRRPRRLRNSALLRASVRQNVLFQNDLIMPVFLTHVDGTKREIP
ncbi:MAG: hypothetical protein KC656_09350, partial [Myxococcales bacterium]|nr:hypothetical protein [Myxococcales bacterium]